MKKLLIILCVLVLGSSVATAGITDKIKAVIARGASAAGQAIDYTQDFEGGSMPADWEDHAPTSSWDQSTAGLDLEGSLCLNLDASEAAQYDPSWNVNDKYFTFYYRTDTNNDAEENMYYVNASDDTIHCFLQIDADQTLTCRVNGGSDNAGSTTTLAANTTYKFKTYCKIDSGPNNGTHTLWVWNGSAWVQECTTTNGTLETTLDNIELKNTYTAGEVYFDYLQVHATDIEDPQ